MSAASGCPYRSYPDTAYWSRTVAGVEAHEIDPIVSVPFTLTKHDKIATAGSCFAQHIARYLQVSGYTYFVAESAPSFIPATLSRKYGFGVFSARFANVYTVRQLLQLILRAYGEFHPTEESWKNGEALVDPFRPAIQPGEFANEEIFHADRRQHFLSVQRMFAECDVFVFTMGLTEAWRHKADGAVYPVCPGCGAGVHDPEKYEFHNFDYEETINDLRQVIDRLRLINPGIRIILTVSPVPLVATATGKHVLAATTYSKSVLLAAAGTIASEDARVAYFPSYEIITSNASRGRYFAPNLRDITTDGIRHVMRIFFKHFAGEALVELNDTKSRSEMNSEIYQIESPAHIAGGLFCEERMLEQFGG